MRLEINFNHTLSWITAMLC